jgi:hypothetical protein
MKRKIFDVAAAVLLLLALFQAGRTVEGISQKKLDLEVLYMPSGEFLEQASLGYRNLAADLLWFRTVQYYGGWIKDENDLSLFSHLIEVITDLDPQFIFAYTFGALIISQDIGYYAGGVEVLKKGMQNNPGNWWIPFEIGFIYYVDAQDYANAERYFHLASRLPGADEIAKRFAAFAAKRSGDLEVSLRMWEELARTSDNPDIRMIAERYIEKLKIQIEEAKSK